MKKKSTENFKKLENNDLKKIKGGIIGWTCINGEWYYLNY